MQVAAAANVEVPAYLALKEKGFDVTCNENVWTARRDELSFTGDGPIQLLGLVAIYETRGEGWKASDEEIHAFLAAFSLD